MADSEQAANSSRASGTNSPSTETVKSYFEHLFANSRDMMNLFSLTQGKVIMLNQAAAEATGYDLDELQRTPVAKLYPVEELAKLTSAFERLASTGYSQDKLRMYARSGELRDIWTRSYVVQREPEIICIVHTIDVTEENRKREREVRNAKLATLGESSATLAHELKNALQSMQFSLGTLRMQLSENANTRIQGSLSRLERAAAHMDDVITSIERSAHGPSRDDSYLSIASAVQNAVLLMQGYLIAKDIALSTEYEPSLPLVSCDRTQLEQILLVLIKNAAQAMAPRERRELRIGARSEGTRVRLDVADSGGGLAPEIEPRIFDAFATTKPAGQGMGLGLSTARKLALDNGVELSCASVPGVGTTFSLLFPAASGPMRPSEEAPLEGRVILLVGDEAWLMEQAKPALAEAGAIVLVASSASEGVQLLRVHTIEAVVCDDAMYPVRGREFVQEVRQFYRGPVCLVTQGRELAPEESIAGVDSVLSKPVESQSLIVTLRMLVA